MLSNERFLPNVSMGSKDCVGVDAECVDTGHAFVRPTVVKFHFQIGSVDWLKH